MMYPPACRTTLLLGCAMRILLSSTCVLCLTTSTAISVTTNATTEEPLLFNISANDVGFAERSLHKFSNRQYASPVLYSGSYSSPVSSPLTVNTYSQPSYGYSTYTYGSSPSTGQLQVGGSTSSYGATPAASSGLTAAGGATSYGGSFSSSYSTQLGNSAALINDLYGSGYSAPSQQVNSNLYSGSYGQSAPAANLQAGSSYGTPSASLIASSSYGTPSAALVATPSPIGSSYGSPSAALVAAPAATTYVQSSSYGSPSSSPIVAAPAPICTQNMYNLTVPDNTPTGIIILRVLAVDPQNLPLKYEILDPVFGTFIINSQTGDVIVSSPLQNFARAIEFNVQVTNSQGQLCVSSVRLNFIATSFLMATTPAYTYGGSGAYGGGSANLVASPAPVAYSSGSSYGSGSSNLVATPSPTPAVSYGGSYGSPSASLVATPAPAISYGSSYGQPSSNLIATPAPATSYGGSYGQPSSNLVATPAPAISYGGSYGGSYGSPNSNLVATPAPAISYGSSYGQPSSNLVATPSPAINYGGSYGSPSSNLVATPAPATNYGGSYGSPSSNLIATPAPATSYGGSYGGSYGSPSSNLVATPAPAINYGGSYGGPSSNLIATPAPAISYGGSYGSPSSNLVATPAPAINYGGSYGSSSSNLIATPAPAAVIYGGSYGQPSSNLIATPAPATNYGGSYGSPSSSLVAAPPAAVYFPDSYASPSSNLVATPTPSTSYGGSYGSPSSNLIATPAPATIYGSGGGYGSPSASLTATMSPYIPIMNPGVGGYGGGGSSSGNLAAAPTFSTGGGSGYIGGSANLVQTGGGGYGGSNNNLVLTQTQQPLFAATFPNQVNNPPSSVVEIFNPNNANLVAPPTQIIRAPEPVVFPTSSGGNKGLESDSLPPAPSSMNWSFFVPNFNGITTTVGVLNGPSTNSIFSLTGSPFFTVDQTGTVSLVSGYCPPRSPMQEQISVRAASADGSAVVQGNLSVVIFIAPSYLRMCSSGPSAAPPTTVQQTPPTVPTMTPAGNLGQGGVSVSFIGDSSFTITKCDGQTGVPQVAASIRARFTPNIDFSQLRITISNSLFKPALPVVCDQTFTCDISIVFSQPLDVTFAGNYAPYITLEGGGLAKLIQHLQVQIVCNDQAADGVPLPPRGRVLDPSKIVPDFPSCGVANISVDVSEDVPVGTVVATLPANGNPAFRYQIIDASAVGYFDLVDPASVAVSSPLFSPTVDSVYVRVAGILGNSTVCATDVFIGVKNVNRNRPVFDQTSYNFAIDCLLPMSLVGTVSASDIDAGRNNIRRFFVAPEDTPLVLVDPASGGIHLRQTLTDSTSFTVFVENPGTKMRSSAVVQISCTGQGSLGRTFQRTTTRAPLILRTESRPRPVVTSNKPVSFPFSVVFSGSGKPAGGAAVTTTTRPLTTRRRDERRLS